MQSKLSVTVQLSKVQLFFKTWVAVQAEVISNWVVDDVKDTVSECVFASNESSRVLKHFVDCNTAVHKLHASFKSSLLLSFYSFFPFIFCSNNHLININNHLININNATYSLLKTYPVHRWIHLLTFRCFAKKKKENLLFCWLFPQTLTIAHPYNSLGSKKKGEKEGGHQPWDVAITNGMVERMRTVMTRPWGWCCPLFFPLRRCLWDQSPN